ncbi:MAG: undecaprenyl/decaprenyl-phosphate alpha-N-acetylglucosaminyl 1-phosphate transferase [Deltaproteobacteria bacterium]|nr:undecaprenyl/decaprenyl-phosphate alpha-N-acetylglucosaminyl 1-phosphate transferase [Deltaproteobacteria bacterium]
MPQGILHLFVTFTFAIVLSLYLTPIVRQGAMRFGVLDHPDGKLKRQHEPIPYLGGIAIYLTFLITLAIIYEFSAYLLGLLLGSTIMVMLGLFDDMKVLPPWLKLAGQFLAAFVLIKSGIAVQLEILPEGLSYLVTVLWLVFITNAVNIIDVADGLASGVGAIAALALGWIAWRNGNILVATTAVALAGSLIGFLKFNFPKARIYLGDAGSLLVGFMLAALSMIAAYTRQNIASIIVPGVLLFIPILEMALVSLARIVRRAAPWHGSGDHFALRLQHRGWSARQIALTTYLVGIAGAAIGFIMIESTLNIALVLGAGVIFLGLLLLVWLWWYCPPPY